MILMAFYGIPIHIMRDLFMTVRSFIKRVNDFVKYRNATRDMNARYPDATAEELGRENTCIVCREEMRPWVQPGQVPAGQRVDERQRPKKLPCGHVLHFSCLRSWLERQQVCPTCRRPVLAEATPANNQQNNQANQGQQNQQNQQNQLNPQNFQQMNNLFGQMNNNQPRPGMPQAQQGQQAPQDGQQNRPAGNMRVFNFGPIRIALGNLRVPDQQPQGNANNIDNNNQVIANLAQQLAQNPAQLQNPRQLQGQVAPSFPALNGLPPPSLHTLHPTDIQSDILRLQQNIIDSLRQLNTQHDQLEYVHALLGELNRLQQVSGVAAANGQELPLIAPLNPPLGLAPIAPQAYFSNGPVLRQNDPGLPAGLVLPDGWTLRPLAQAPQIVHADSQSAAPSQRAPSEPAGDHGVASVASNTSPHTETSQTPPSSSGAPGVSSPTAKSSSKTAEPSSLESSWSFGNIAGATEGEGSSSAVAGSSSDNHNITKRTATVEDADDNGR